MHNRYRTIPACTLMMKCRDFCNTSVGSFHHSCRKYKEGQVSLSTPCHVGLHMWKLDLIYYCIESIGVRFFLGMGIWIKLTIFLRYRYPTPVVYPVHGT